MAAGGTPSNVKLGPGRIYYAALGTAEPTLGSAVLPSAWNSLGYTENGSEIAFNLTTEGIAVAEEIDDIDSVITARDINFIVEAAESTKKNLMLVAGGGAATANNGTAFQLPAPGAEVGVMMIHDSLDTPDILNRRTLMRKVMPGGNISMAHRKAPNKTTLPATFRLVKPDASLEAVTFFPDQTGRV